MNEEDEVMSSSTLPSLGYSRPRPRRNHKLSATSSLSPTYTSLPSLFEDDQLSAFFPSLPQNSADLPDSPSSAPSVLKGSRGECYRYPSIQEEIESLNEDTMNEQEQWIMKGTGRSDKNKEDVETKKIEEKIDKTRMEEKEVKKDDGTGKEKQRMETRKQEDKREEEKETDNKVATGSEFNCSSVADEVFYALRDTPLSQPRPASNPPCLTPDSLPESYYTTNEGPPTDILSSPQSAYYDDEDVPLRFVYPPKISRLGSIYSHLSPSKGGSCSSDSESDTCASLSKRVTMRAKEKQSEQRNIDGKNVRSAVFEPKDELDSTAGETPKNSEACKNSITSLGRRDQQTKKVPPSKPPRMRVGKRVTNNEEKRKSREDPVRYYTRLGDQDKLSSKRSVSMTNINERSNFELTPEKHHRFSRSPAKEVTGLLQPHTRVHDERKDRDRHSGFRYKDAAKIVSSIMPKKPQFLQRSYSSRPKVHPSKKTGKEEPPTSLPPPSKSPSPPSPAPQPRRKLSATPALTPRTPAAAPAPAPAVEELKQNDTASEVAKQATEHRHKDQEGVPAGSLVNAQETCSSHGALLHFYCVKCRVVVCRDCTVVAHSQGENHKVLDTLDSLATLRSEAVAMLRHYTILDNMHASLMEIYSKFTLQHRHVDLGAMKNRLEEGKYLATVVKEAEQMVTTWTNLHQIRKCVSQWEARQDEWGDLVYLAARCSLLENMCFPSDTVQLRLGNWVMPTPWIQLSHLLLPYLRESRPRTSSTSSSLGKDDQLTPHGNEKALKIPSPVLNSRVRSSSPYSGGSSTGGTDKPFPNNARQMVLCNLVPYIILNPNIRYFVHVSGPRDVDLTLVVVPVENHARDCLQQRRTNSAKTPEMLSQTNTTMNAITLVEQQMTSGSCKTRITASSMPLGSSAASTVVKVSFTDVKVVGDGQGLPEVENGLKRGDVIVDHSSSGRVTLTVVVRDIGNFPGLHLGHVIWGMDSLACLLDSEDTKRMESGGFRAKIKATVKREEAVYDMVFGMDL